MELATFFGTTIINTIIIGALLLLIVGLF